MSRITVYFGDAGTSAWAGEATVNNVRSFRAGRFNVFFSGGVPGECSGKSYGRALDVSRPREGVLVEPSIDSAEIAGWRVEVATRDDGSIELSAARGEQAHSAMFNQDAVAQGRAQMEVLSGDERSVITYDPARADRFSIDHGGVLAIREALLK